MIKYWDNEYSTAVWNIFWKKKFKKKIKGKPEISKKKIEKLKKWVQVFQRKHFDLLKPLRLSRVIRRGQNGGNFVQDF